MCIDIGSRTHDNTSQSHLDTNRREYVFTPTLAHTDSRTDGWMDRGTLWLLAHPGVYTDRHMLADMHACRHSVPHGHTSNGMLLYPYFCEALPGEGGGRGSRSALSLGHCGHLSVPMKVLLPVPNPHGASFICTFFSRRSPCLLNAHSWGGRCVQHELGWGRPLLDLGWAPRDVLSLGRARS